MLQFTSSLIKTTAVVTVCSFTMTNAAAVYFSVQNGSTPTPYPSTDCKNRCDSYSTTCASSSNPADISELLNSPEARERTMTGYSEVIQGAFKEVFQSIRIGKKKPDPKFFNWSAQNLQKLSGKHSISEPILTELFLNDISQKILVFAVNTNQKEQKMGTYKKNVSQVIGSEETLNLFADLVYYSSGAFCCELRLTK